VEKNEGGRRKKIAQAEIRALGGDQQSPAGHRPTPNPVQSVVIFLKFIYFEIYFFGSLGNGLGLLGEWVYNTPIF
jgi:hypothetical protein